MVDIKAGKGSKYAGTQNICIERKRGEFVLVFGKCRHYAWVPKSQDGFWTCIFCLSSLIRWLYFSLCRRLCKQGWCISCFFFGDLSRRVWHVPTHGDRMKSDGVEWIQTEWHTDRKVRIRTKVQVTIFRMVSITPLLHLSLSLWLL